MTETQPQSNEQTIMAQIVELIETSAGESASRHLLAINVACSLLSGCCAYTEQFKKALKNSKSGLSNHDYEQLKFFLDVCNRFKQAEKQFEKRKGK